MAYCWVIDPLKKTAWEYSRDKDKILMAGKITISLAELFTA